MRRDDADYAVAARNDGVRMVSRLTWRAGAVGIICSALIAAAFGHNVRHTVPTRQAPGTIVIPAQPPAPVQGAGQVTSGAS